MPTPTLRQPRPALHRSLHAALALGGTLVAVVLLSSSARAAPPTKPNVVLIHTDDLGINDLACYGRKEHRTPHLDALSREGARFTSAYASQPICSPSRAGLLTGRAPARLHLTTYLPGRPDTPAQRLLHPPMRQELPLEERTLAEVLRDAGYATAAIGKWHLGGAGFGPEAQGFSTVASAPADTTPSLTEGSKSETALTDAAIRFVEQSRQRPFFLYLAHNNPHIPYTATPEATARFAGAWNPVYAAVIEALDQAVGRLLGALDRLGLAERTIVVFVSDNGGLHVPEKKLDPSTHNSPFRAGKGFVYEGGLRVPLLVRWPGRVKPGLVSDVPVMNTDLLPTLLELAGVGAPGGLDGASVASVLLGGTVPPRRLHWHFPHYTNQGGRPAGAIRDGTWKLVEQYEDGSRELYDLTKDPGETTNLAKRFPARAAALAAALESWRRAVGAQRNTPNPAFVPELGKAIYRDVDVSRLRPAATAVETGRPLAAWRRQMDAAGRSGGPSGGARQDASPPGLGRPPSLPSAPAPTKAAP